MRLRSLHGLGCGFPARFNCRPIASYRSSVSCSESCCSCRINSVLVSFNDAPIAPQSCVRALRTCSALRVRVLLTVLFGCRRRCFLGSHMLHWPGGVSRFRGATTHGKLPPYVFDQRPRKKKSIAQSSGAKLGAHVASASVFSACVAASAKLLSGHARHLVRNHRRDARVT